MSSRHRSQPGATAAWRLSLWTTLVFAAGSALAFVIVQYVVAQSFRQRSDAWLSGEAEVLAEVAMRTPRGQLHDRVVEEMAELAEHELPDQRNAHGQPENSVFFLEMLPGHRGPLWVGPGPPSRFVPAIEAAHLHPGIPRSIAVAGWPQPFRVVVQQPAGVDGPVYLGLSDEGEDALLQTLELRFLLIWAGVVALGFLTAFNSAHRTLRRVESISEAVATIDSHDLGGRLPEGPHADEIARLSRTFNRMLDRIEASVHQLHGVTGALAHDLKSPVTSIRGRLELALSSPEEEIRQESLAQAIEHLDQLSRYLNTALDLAEAEAGALRLQCECVDLGSLVRHMTELYEPAFAEAAQHLTVQASEPVLVEVDVTLMHRVFANLLDNALHHLPPGRRVTIEVRHGNGVAEVSVEDDGPGFPPDLRERALRRFARGNRSGGRGLGLAFVDAAVQAHGGSVILGESSHGGARIILQLPQAWNA